MTRADSVRARGSAVRPDRTFRTVAENDGRHAPLGLMVLRPRAQHCAIHSCFLVVGLSNAPVATLAARSTLEERAAGCPLADSW